MDVELFLIYIQSDKISGRIGNELLVIIIILIVLYLYTMILHIQNNAHNLQYCG